MPAFLTFILPIVSKLAASLVSRAIQHGVTTAQGTVAGAAVIGFLSSIGCDLTLAQQATVAAIAAAPGVLATDAKKTAPAMLEAAKEAVAEAKRPKPENDAPQAS